MTYLSLFVVDGQIMMVDPAAEELVIKVLDDSYPLTTVRLPFAHGSPFTIRCDQIQGYTISTPESRAAYAELVAQINAEEDPSNPPWK